MKFNEWRNIDNNVENFIFGIENEQILLNNNNNSITVNIASIKNGKTMSFNVKIPNENKNILKVHFNVLPIIPEGRKYWDDEKKEYCQLLKENLNLHLILPFYLKFKV